MTTATQNGNELLTVRDLRSLLKMSDSTVRRLVDSQALPFMKIRGAIRFRMADVEAYLEEQTVRPVVQKKTYGNQKD